MRRVRLLWMTLALLAALGALGLAQGAPVRVLVLDETKTFVESLQVNALVGLLKQDPALAVTARLVEVDSSLDLPLSPGELEGKFDLVVLIPRDLGRSRTVWLFGRPFYAEREPEVAAAAARLRALLERVFAPQGAQVEGVADDLFPALVAGFFLHNGWL